PLDEKTILSAAKEAGAVVSVEEHQAAGGLGSAIAEFLSKNHPTPMEFVAVQDRFGQSGEPAELMKEYRLDIPAIVEAVERVYRRKK
ncbi:MAG: transketolase C-terminal domain-containing protein, partial [bacterium]|nr:transketolase C-terminal domain-containing protein [bacterium]